MSLIQYAIFAFIVSCSSILLLSPVADKYGLVDLPNNRKLHSGEIPLIGGISIFISVLLCSTFLLESTQTFNLYIISASLILFVGVLDDKYDLPVSLRLFAQIITASILVFGAGLYIQSFGEIFYLFEFRLESLGTIVTIIAVLGAINAFNMVDGIDGLAGMLSLVSFTSLGVLFYISNIDWIALCVMFSAAILGYLVFNLRWPFSSVNKIFMGDAGSMLIGLTIVWLLVIGSDPNAGSFRPVTALYIIALPLMDMVAIMYRRIKKGQSPFEPDRDHLHHIFERAGFNRKQTLVLITLLASTLAGIGILGELFVVSEWKMFTGFVLLFFAYNYILQNIWTLLARYRKKD